MLISGERGEIIATVKPEDTVRALAMEADDGLPEVLATSRLLGLVELAASRAMRRVLRAGQSSLGVGTSMAHDKATAVGSQVCAVARFYSHRDGLLKFHFEVYDEAGLIAEGEHTRSIVDSGTLADHARSRQTWAEWDAA
jgi:fluoroacetyl-CoA thioesterase